MTTEQRASLMSTYVGERRNRRHRPGRAFERTDYRFELVTDYGAFRDLQRHRLLTIEWQPLTVDLGYDVPEVVVEAGLAARYEESLRALGRALLRHARESSPSRPSTRWRWRFGSVT